MHVQLLLAVCQSVVQRDTQVTQRFECMVTSGSFAREALVLTVGGEMILQSKEGGREVLAE